MTICLKDGIQDCLGDGPLPQIEAHPLAIVILTPFILIFVWAAWVEFRRWWRYGPSQNRRSDFPIDEDAPSYEAPRDED